MSDDRSQERRRLARQLMRAMTGDGEPVIITETGEVGTPQHDHLAQISPSASYHALIDQRQREYEAIRSQRRPTETYRTSEEWGDQNQREHEAYARTLAGVAYSLDLGFFTGDNETLAHVIYEAVMRIPDDVREFVSDQIVFLSGTWGQAFRGMDWSGKWIILLAPDLPPVDAAGIVAHQIAHAWRGHGEGTYGYTADEERDACAMALAWGFTGTGTIFDEGDAELVTSYIN